MQPFEVEKGVPLQQFSCYRSAFTVPKKTKRLTSAKVFKDHAKASANLAEDRHYYCTSYHVATSAAEEIGTMVKRQRKWYFCQPVSMSKTHYRDRCICHQVLISLRFGKLWRSVRWRR